MPSPLPSPDLNVISDQNVIVPPLKYQGIFVEDSLLPPDFFGTQSARWSENVPILSVSALLTPNNKALLVKRLSPNAIMPQRATEGAVGYDLSSAVDTTVPANDRIAVPTDLAIANTPGTYARLAPRSGLALKKFLGLVLALLTQTFGGISKLSFLTTQVQIFRSGKVTE